MAAPIILFSFLFFFSVSVSSLNVGVQLSHPSIVLSKECSRKCESEYCKVPPLLRYGKYCGLLYSGCRGERPCDDLDLCCMKHDDCVSSKNNDYLSQECSQTFINCMNDFSEKKRPTFKGNKCDAIKSLMSSLLLWKLLLSPAESSGNPNLMPCYRTRAGCSLTEPALVI